MDTLQEKKFFEVVISNVELPTTSSPLLDNENWLKEKSGYLLSKEELIDLLSDAFESGRQKVKDSGGIGALNQQGDDEFDDFEAYKAYLLTQSIK